MSDGHTSFIHELHQREEILEINVVKKEQRMWVGMSRVAWGKSVKSPEGRNKHTRQVDGLQQFYVRWLGLRLKRASFPTRESLCQQLLRHDDAIEA